jgi:hypothetical protein
MSSVDAASAPARDSNVEIAGDGDRSDARTSRIERHQHDHVGTDDVSLLWPAVEAENRHIRARPGSTLPPPEKSSQEQSSDNEQNTRLEQEKKTSTITFLDHGASFDWTRL